MKNRFEGKSFEEAKRLYRKLAFECHPDKGGTAEEFHKLTKEFEDHLKKSNTNDDISSNNLEILITEILQIIPENYVSQFTGSSLYRVFISGIISDTLALLGKNNGKVKDLENIIRKLKP